ncbi:hypothetical protein ElyMa_000769800 [Elysia marginata]|uniref:Mab-21-like HhH/H2TH-like domain-containing protein n=1 Tax=Elysia marginata TaxID=1093978 RepID=A0AAV4GVM9_9GAST|nr:hypothetical protein ElyMa_000769800 [Elysia marginata]
MALGERSPPKQRMKKHSSPACPRLPPIPSPLRLSPHHLYIPQLHRQQTTVASLSPVGQALARLADTVLNPDPGDLNSGPGLAAQQELSSILDSIYVSLSRSASQGGLRFRKFILAQALAHWQLRPECRVVCFLPMEIKGAILCPRDSGTGYVQLPVATDKEEFPPMKTSFVSDDFRSLRYVSSRKVYHVLKKLLARSLLSKQTPLERLKFSSSERKLEILLQNEKDWVGEIVPCFVMKDANTMFCCKPYNCESPREMNSTAVGDLQSYSCTPRSTAAEDDRPDPSEMSECDSHMASPAPSLTQPQAGPLSQILDLGTLNADLLCAETPRDVVWYACAPRSENRLVTNICRTDNGVRMSAVRLVHRLCAADWRLRDVSMYEVHTAMLHDTDHQLDHAPRWQRDALEPCVRVILAKLGQFAQAQYLPHFLVQGVNLWERVPAKRFLLMSGAINRLTFNNVALVSLVCRAGQFSLPTDHDQIYSDFLTPSPRQQPEKRLSTNRSLQNNNKTEERHPVRAKFCKMTIQSRDSKNSLARPVKSLLHVQASCASPGLRNLDRKSRD